MSETDLAARLDAVERALTDDDADVSDVRDDAARVAAIEDLESRVADLEATVDELDAALQAVRGYAGNVRAVNREVERRASAALAKAETLETAIDDPPHDDPTASRFGDAPLTVDATPATATGDRTDRDAGRREHDERDRIRPRGEGRTGTGSRVREDRRGGEGRARAPDPDGASDRDGDPDTARGEDGSGSGTEQFIERVRDAL